MSDHPLTTGVIDFYTDINAKVNIKARFNEEAHPPRIRQLFGQLSEEILKRYLGSGIVIPENIEGARILDIGCGAGSLVFILSKLVGPTGYVVGIDITPGLIETAKQESDYHVKAWGYKKQNFEFHVANAERLLEMGLEPFDVIVSNGVFCVIPDKDTAFKAAYTLLKPGSQFYINDVLTQTDLPEEAKNSQKLWSLGTAGSMLWYKLREYAGKVGFTEPYLTQSAGINIKNEETKAALNNAKFTCAAYRLFKLPPGAKRGAATVTYKGNIPDCEDAFPWDIDLTFKKGVPVNVDAQLATILAFTIFSKNFDIKDFSGEVKTNRNQDPFKRLEQLASQGKAPEPIYSVE